MCQCYGISMVISLWYLSHILISISYSLQVFHSLHLAKICPTSAPYYQLVIPTCESCYVSRFAIPSILTDHRYYSRFLAFSLARGTQAMSSYTYCTVPMYLVWSRNVSAIKRADNVFAALQKMAVKAVLNWNKIMEEL